MIVALTCEVVIGLVAGTEARSLIRRKLGETRWREGRDFLCTA